MKLIELVRQSLLSDGNVSAMRVNMLLIILTACSTFIMSNLAMLVKAAFKDGALAMVDLPTQMAIIVGAVIAGKAVQTFGEKETKKEEK
jgi:hypothetical protein